MCIEKNATAWKMAKGTGTANTFSIRVIAFY